MKCRSDSLALLDNITIYDKVVLNFDGSFDFLDMETGQFVHHLNSEIGDIDALFLVHFGAPPISGANPLDKQCRKSLYYRDLEKKRP